MMDQLPDSLSTSEDSPSSQRTQTINVGRWSAAEDSRLREAVIKYGNRWIVVAPEVGTRNSEQCAKRWNDNLNPNLDRSFWSVEEDKLLLQLVTLYGHNWKLMTKSSFQARSSLSLKNRYCLLQRRQKRQIKRQQQASSKSKYGEVAMITPPANFDDSSIPCSPFSISTHASSLPLPGITAQSGINVNTMQSLNNDLDMGGMFPASGIASVQNTYGTGQYNSSITATGVVGQGYMYNREQDTTSMEWNRHNFCDSIDLNSLFSGTDMCFHPDNSHKSIPDTQRSSDTSKPEDKGMEVSVTCSRSRLRAMVCRAFESAMKETRGLAEEDQVTVTLRMRN